MTNVCFDECLSPRIAECLAAFFHKEHIITHTRVKFGSGIKDINQIERLSGEGQWIFISLDSMITKNKEEQRALKSANLISFFLAGSLNKTTNLNRLKRILFVWEELETKATLAKTGAIFVIPLKGSIKPMKFK